MLNGFGLKGETVDTMLTPMVHSQEIDVAVAHYHSLCKQEPRSLSEVEINSPAEAYMQNKNAELAIKFYGKQWR